MALHLIKLGVGAESIADLEEWVAECVRQGEQVHTTRMMPSRRAEILEGGSLYWVIKGVLSCRQRITALEAIVDGEGISRCNIHLDPVVVPVEPRPRGPFQGWRYLEDKDVPRDLVVSGTSDDALPLEMQRVLALIGVR